MRGQGFTPPNRVEYNEVNLDQLNSFTANSEVTPELLAEASIVHKTRNPIVILGRGELAVPLKVRVHRVSKSARAKIEAAGGSVELL
jgi:large subunit ribosomal protein L15